LIASVAKPKLHGKIFLIVFQARHGAVFLDDPAVDAEER
jgi:hypothetical protein